MNILIILLCFAISIFSFYAMIQIYSFNKFQEQRFKEFKNIIKKIHTVKLKYILRLDQLRMTVDKINGDNVVSIYHFGIRKELNLLLREYIYLVHNIYLIKVLYDTLRKTFFKSKISNICTELHEVYKLLYEDYTALITVLNEYEKMVQQYAIDTKISTNEKEYFLAIFSNYADKRKVIDYLEVLTRITKIMFMK